MNEETMVEAAPTLVPVDGIDEEIDDVADDALLENLLVEEVSIDGMCGVY
jgi:mycofactocin precursor